MLEFKKCQICRISKSYNSEHFYRDKTKIYGFMHICKECYNKKRNKIPKIKYKTLLPEDQLKRNKEKVKSFRKTIKGKCVSRAKSYKKFDQERNYENNITNEDIFRILGTPCTYCGFPSTGFDRINNSKGHTRKNCVAACKDCNTARMDNFSSEEMKIIGKSIREVKLSRLIMDNIDLSFLNQF